MRTKSILLLFIVSTTIIMTLSFNVELDQGEDQLIVGTWVPEGSPNHKIVFSSDGIVKEYNEKQIIYATYNYQISKSSPQCGTDVDTGPQFSYLSMQNDNDSICYEILTLNNEYLAIRTLGSGGQDIYLRQN